MDDLRFDGRMLTYDSRDGEGLLNGAAPVARTERAGSGS